MLTRGTLLGCTGLLRRGRRKYHHQCPLGSVASDLIYADVRLHIPMTPRNDRPTRFPRNQTPTPPPTPPSPAPPAPPSPPTPPAPPTPGGMVWECHGGAIVDVKKLTGITDQDLKKSKISGLTACEAACIQTPTCVALYVHEVDEHCHVLLGAAKPTHAQFVAALKPKKKHSSCILVPKPPSVVHV